MDPQLSVSNASSSLQNTPSLLVETLTPSALSLLAPSNNDRINATGVLKTESETRTSKLLVQPTESIREERREYDDSENQSDKASIEGVKDITASNSFLMRIVHGRVPNQLL